MGDDSTKPLDISLYSPTSSMESHVRVQRCRCATVGLFLRCSKLPFLLGRGNCTEESLDFKVVSLGLEGGWWLSQSGLEYTYWETPRSYGCLVVFDVLALKGETSEKDRSFGRLGRLVQTACIEWLFING